METNESGEVQRWRNLRLRFHWLEYCHSCAKLAAANQHKFKFANQNNELEKEPRERACQNEQHSPVMSHMFGSQSTQALLSYK